LKPPTSIYLSICLSIHLSIYLSIHLSVWLSIWKDTIMCEFLRKWKLADKWSSLARLLQKWTFTAPKRRNSARLLQKNVPFLPSFLKPPQNPHIWLTCVKVHKSMAIHGACHAKPHPNAKKWSENFTPQPRAFLRGSTSKNCSDAEVLLTFLLRQCGSRHGSVQVSISHPTRWLHAGSFSEPTFRPSAAPKHWKNRVFRDFSTFSHTLIFLLTLSCLTFPSTVATPFHR